MIKLWIDKVRTKRKLDYVSFTHKILSSIKDGRRVSFGFFFSKFDEKTSKIVYWI